MSLQDPNVVNPARKKRVAMVIANPATSTTTGWPVGFWLSELTHSSYLLTESGYEIEVFSPDGVTVTAFFAGRFLRETRPGGYVLYTADRSTRLVPIDENQREIVTRRSPGPSVDCGQKIVSHTLRVKSGRRAERRLEPLEPKEIVVGVARLDQTVGVQEKPVFSAQGLFQFRVAVILDKAKNQPVLLHFVHLSSLRALRAASGGAQRRHTESFEIECR